MLTTAIGFDADVNILVGSVRTINRNTESLMFGSKENGLERNADKSKYIIMSRDKNRKKKSQYKS